MCLCKVTNWKPEPTGIGFKVVIVRPDGSFHSPLYGGKQIYELNKWVSDYSVYSLDTRDLSIYRRVKYKSGFHIFTELKDARRYFNSIACDHDAGILEFGTDESISIVRLEYKDAIVIGTQEIEGNLFSPCVVASSIKILEELAQQHFLDKTNGL